MAFPIRVADVMSSPVRTAPPDRTARAAANECQRAGVGSLVVVEDDAVVGIVTSDDFVALLGDVDGPGETPLSSFMSRDVVTVAADTPIGDAVARMFEHDIARLVVLEDDELVGLVSTDDVVRHVPQVYHRRVVGREEPPEHRYRRSQETAYEAEDWAVEGMGLSDDSIDVGDRVTFSKTIEERDVRTFAAASGDTNRLHLDEAYARETRFGRRIVHGTLVSGLISAALARLPGVSIYLSQDLSFLQPVDVGDRVTATCEVVGDLGRRKYQFTTDVADADGEQVIKGQAVVMVDEAPETGRVTAEVLAED